MPSVKDWEIIATNLSRERWDWGCIVSMDSEGRDIFVVQAQRDGKRFVVRADEKLAAFVGLERQGGDLPVSRTRVVLSNTAQAKRPTTKVS